MPHPSAFKTADGEAQYLAAYNAGLALWPVPYEEMVVPTPFGMTHVVVSGPKDGHPLVLLHGYMGTALMWTPNIADLSQDHRVYAIDVMGQPGKSVPTEPIRGAADYTSWLTTTLDGLGLDSVYLVGMSFGGWLALRYAVAAPGRVEKLALLSPGGMLPIKRQFALRGLLMMLIPTRFMVERFMRWAGFREALGPVQLDRMFELMSLGLKHFRIPQETLRVAALALSDAELEGLTMPVLLLLGDREVLYDPAAAVARGRRLVPDFQGELIPRSSHDMCFSQHRIVDSRVLDFLGPVVARAR